jgi:hypothetical protein
MLIPLPRETLSPKHFLDKVRPIQPSTICEIRYSPNRWFKIAPKICRRIPSGSAYQTVSKNDDFHHDHPFSPIFMSKKTIHHSEFTTNGRLFVFRIPHSERRILPNARSLKYPKNIPALYDLFAFLAVL